MHWLGLCIWSTRFFLVHAGQYFITLVCSACSFIYFLLLLFLLHFYGDWKLIRFRMVKAVQARQIKVPVYGSRRFGLLSPESGGSFNAVFAGFWLREEMIPLHPLCRLFIGIFSGLVWSPFLLSPCSIDSRSNPLNPSSFCD